MRLRGRRTAQNLGACYANTRAALPRARDAKSPAQTHPPPSFPQQLRARVAQPDSGAFPDPLAPQALASADAATVAPSPGGQQPNQQQPQPQPKAPPPDTRPRDRADLYKAVGIGAFVSVVAGILDHQAVEDHQGLAMGCVFCLGYAGIIAEDLLGFNKAGVALGTAVALWIIRSTGGSPELVEGEMSSVLTQVSELIYFLIGAMTVVEVVDAHGGFRPLAAAINAGDAAPQQRNTKLLWGVGLLTFFLSACLDNLTTTIVMLSVLQRAIPEDKELRKLLGATVVIAANAGGAWTPIGDVTTTMLWLHGQLTPIPTMRDLLLPSLVSLVVPLGLLQTFAPEFNGSGSGSGETKQLAATSAAAAAEAEAEAASGAQQQAPRPAERESLLIGSAAQPAEAIPVEVLAFEEASSRGPLVLAVGLVALMSVPVFKHFTGLPPYMGILCGLSVLWLLTDALHFGESR